MRTFGIVTIFDGITDYEEVNGDHFWVNERDGTLVIYDGERKVAAYAKPYWVSVEEQPEEEAAHQCDCPPLPDTLKESPTFIPPSIIPDPYFPGPNTNPLFPGPSLPFPGTTFTWCTCGGGEGC